MMCIVLLEVRAGVLGLRGAVGRKGNQPVYVHWFRLCLDNGKMKQKEQGRKVNSVPPATSRY